MEYGSHFNQVTEGWDKGLRDAVFQYRHAQMVSGYGNICTPAGPDIHKFLPFERSDYIWRAKLGNFSSDAWSAIKSAPPPILVNANPLEHSQVREGGFGVWDAAAGIPAGALRGRKIYPSRRLTAQQRCNIEWNTQTRPAIIRSGPLGIGARNLRPQGPGIIDLEASRLGWEILETAHALAHARKDGCLNPAAVRECFVETVAEVVFAIIYDLPLWVSNKRPVDEPDFCYGIELVNSLEIADPQMFVPWNTVAAPIPDRTLCVMLAATRIAPHPRAFEKRLESPGPDDNWCCMPNIVALAGWAGVDMLMHQPLFRKYVGDEPARYAPVCYGADAADLMPAGTMWAYLAEARARFGSPTTSDNRRYFHEWRKSPAFAKLLDNTPPLICRGCMEFMQEASAPRRSRPEFKKEDKDYAEQLERKRGVDRAYALVDTAAAKYEMKISGDMSANISKKRNGRRSNHKGKLAQERRNAVFVHLTRKHMCQGMVPVGGKNAIGALTARQKRVYNEFISNNDNVHVAELRKRAREMGHPVRHGRKGWQ